MFQFGGKKRDSQGPTAVDRAKSLAAEGRSESDIIRSLKKEGFSNEDISRALNQVLKMKVSGPIEPPPSDDDRFVAPPPSKLEEMYQPSERQTIDMTEEEEIGLEELIEEIVNERWGDMASIVTDIKDEIKGTQEQVAGFEGRVSSIEASSGGEKEDVMKRFEEMEMKVESLEGKVSSMEKMLKEILPSLTDNVRNLSRTLGKPKIDKDDFDL